MARQTANIRICDHCEAQKMDDGVPRIGGSVFTGWVEVKLIDGSTHLDALRKKKDFDFCSFNCMKLHF